MMAFLICKIMNISALTCFGFSNYFNVPDRYACNKHFQKVFGLLPTIGYNCRPIKSLLVAGYWLVTGQIVKGLLGRS